MRDGKGLIQKEFVLEGLDCANCAMKIEKKVAGLEGVNHCQVNFATQILSMQFDETEQTEIVKNTKRKILQLEPHIKIKEV